MKIALVTFDFDANRKGGLSSVSKKIIEILSDEYSSQIEIVSFANSIIDVNSIALSRPKSYRNRTIEITGKFRGIPIIKIGSIGSEFEFLRYRRRIELTKFFNSYDLIIIVTGILQFANVIPKIKAPIIVQCATRLIWERRFQYPAMSKFRRSFLKLQMPFLALQERRVLNSKMTFLVENSKMKSWIDSKFTGKTEMWFPGVGDKDSDLVPDFVPNRNGHFVSVGRLDESRKGWDRLLLAYKAAVDLHISLPNLLIIGSGSFSIETQQLVNRLTPDYGIKILGNLSDRDRDSKIQSASFFLQTSFEEGLGLAALEALKYGVPLICSETDGSKEYVHEGVSGKLVPQGDNFVNRFAEAIKESQNWDYERLSAKSRKLFESLFTDEISRQKLLEVISDSRRRYL